MAAINLQGNENMHHFGSVIPHPVPGKFINTKLDYSSPYVLYSLI